jgi:hypothetical protein
MILPSDVTTGCTRLLKSGTGWHERRSPLIGEKKRNPTARGTPRRRERPGGGQVMAQAVARPRTVATPSGTPNRSIPTRPACGAQATLKDGPSRAIKFKDHPVIVCSIHQPSVCDPFESSQTRADGSGLLRTAKGAKVWTPRKRGYAPIHRRYWSCASPRGKAAACSFIKSQIVILVRYR